jgi:branched-chain amino acid transport system ATP-binding protein
MTIANAKPILRVENATKNFGGLVANQDISFEAREGEIVGVVGPNGAGKTTLFNSLSGAHRLSSGRIYFRGKDITRMHAHDICRHGIGRTFQIPQSLNNMTVFENVLVGSMFHHRDMKGAQAYADEVVDFCGLTRYRRDMVGRMNVIQKKRIEIARALATKPELLLLDETMAGLDDAERKESVEFIHRINERGITIITIEHVMDVLMAVSDRVVVINSGKLLMQGTPKEVASNEQVIEAYLGGQKKHG